MSMDPAESPSTQPKKAPHRPPPLQTASMASGQSFHSAHPHYNPAASPPITPRYPLTSLPPSQYTSPPQNYPQAGSNGAYQHPPPRRESYNREPYNPNAYGPVSPPAHQQFFSPPPGQLSAFTQTAYPTSTTPQPSHQQQHQNQYIPPGYVPPPPPPGPPPSQQLDYSSYTGSYPSGPGGYAHNPARTSQSSQQQGQGDPWAGLNNLK